MAFNWRKFPWTNLHDLNLDWIIQTVKTLENNLADAVSTFKKMIDEAISNTLTGSGDLTISKTGDVRISGTGVNISGGGTHISGSGDFTVNKAGAVRLSGSHVYLSDTFISGGGSEILTLNNSNSGTNVSFGYNSGVLSLTNNQELAKGVAVYPINTPADGGGDNSTFAANVGYVKDAVTTVDGKLDTEIENRTSGDAALQSTIDNVIMPLINALQNRAPRVFYFNTTAEAGTLTADEVSTIKTALIDHTPVIFIAPAGASQYYYYCVDCTPKPNSENINSVPFAITFKTLDGLYKAGLTFSGSGGSGTVIFDTIS